MTRKEYRKFLKFNPPMLGKKHTEEARNKIKEARSRQIITEETKRKISIAGKGRKWSEESKRKLGNSKKGNKYALGYRWSNEVRKKNSDSHKGNKSNLWKGGLTSINKIIRMSLEYRLWREAVFERDNYTCIWCGARSEVGKVVILNADHIKPFALFPELRFAIDNGRTLCRDCHKTTDTWGRQKIESDL